MIYCRECGKVIPKYTNELVMVPHARVGVYSMYHKNCLDSILSRGEKQ